jgi:glycosyltransferase involved in cell wall biosynthesis
MATPIILGVEGESRAIVEEAAAGIGVEPENATELAAAVRRLADDPALRATLGGNGHEYVRRHFDRRVLAKRYLELLASLVSPACGERMHKPCK